MYRVQHTIPDTPMRLLVPHDPADTWFLKFLDADGVSWRVTPDGCEVELSPAYVEKLMGALVNRLLPPTAASVASVYRLFPPPVPSMDAPPPLPFVADVAEPTHVVYGGES